MQATDTLEQSVVERLWVAALARQDELNAWIGTQANDLAFVARWEEILRTTSTIMNGDATSLPYHVAHTRVSEILRDVVVRRPDFEELFILNNDGIVVVSSQRIHEGQDFADMPFFSVGRTQTFIQNVYPDIISEHPRMTIATPMLNEQGRRIGVLGVHVNLDRMDRIILDRSGLGETGETYLLDKRGVFVSANRFGRQNFTTQVQSEGISRALEGESGTGRYPNYRGIPVIGAYQWLDTLELALLVEMEQEEAFAPINQLALNSTLAGIIAACVLIVGVYMLVRSIAQPILQLTDAARDVAAGNLNVTAPVVTQDEIGVLAQVFNQMTAQLRGLYERMEQKVAARTTELTQANTQLTNEVAERRRIEEQLLQAKEEAETANRAKSTFLANMSHELRTPLSAIIGFAQILHYDPHATDNQRNYVQIINRNSQHLRDLINDVLEMSKIEAGRMTLNITQFNLHELLDDLEKTFTLRAQQKNLLLVFDCLSDVPETICTDEQKLRQILINLLSNAIKFTQAGSVILAITQKTPHTQDSNMVLEFSVQDTGPGITPDEMGMLFQAFGQTRTGQQSQESTGLGLTISRRFVQLMGGDMTVQSEIGVGSVFTFNIHVTVDQVCAGPDESESYHVIGLATDQPTYRILVADDIADSRHMLTLLLEQAGFDVREADNGQHAIEVWEAWAPHLILMDMRMPEMDGYEATRYIKSTPEGSATSIIALTASTFEEERSRIVAAGCDDFIGKPFLDSEIFEHIAKHLGVTYLYESEVRA